jgi:hypothetical protein
VTNSSFLHPLSTAITIFLVRSGTRDWYAKGIVTKDKFEEVLRAHQAAVDATRSEQRVRYR